MNREDFVVKFKTALHLDQHMGLESIDEVAEAFANVFFDDKYQDDENLKTIIDYYQMVRENNVESIKTLLDERHKAAEDNFRLSLLEIKDKAIYLLSLLSAVLSFHNVWFSVMPIVCMWIFDWIIYYIED